MGRLERKSVLVTGGARGMGESHSRLFVEEGARVTVADIDVERGQALAAELGGSAQFVSLDVTSSEAWADALDAVLARFGALDVLVNNAGISVTESLEETTREQWETALTVNLTGAFFGIKACVPALKQSEGASIVNISSTAGLRGYPNSVAYNASKFGLRGLTKAAAVDLAPYGIRVNSVHPGTVRTEMVRAVTDSRQHILMKRMGEPIEISHLVLFLASDESSFSTGAEFVADGGETAGRPSLG
jgi:3alpha(or 20beta)-hydroxysteroid dehydrogenase